MAKRIPVFFSLAAVMAAVNLPDLLIAGADKVEFTIGMFAGPLALVGLALTKRPWLHASVLVLIMVVVVLFMGAGIDQIHSRFLGEGTVSFRPLSALCMGLFLEA